MKRPTSDRTLTAQQFTDALAVLGWKQTDFARRVGMTTQTVNRWATGLAPCPLWLSEYLGAMQDLKALHTKYLDPAGAGDQESPERLAQIVPKE